MTITSCLVCHKEKKEDGSVLAQCSKCRAAKYCSKACQEKDWKNHKRWCKLTETIPIDSTVIQADPFQQEELLDMNAVLDYAGSYLDDLKHVHIFIPERVIVEWRGLFRMNHQHLKSFLEKRPLQSFSLTFHRRYPHVVRAITDAGLAFAPIATHQPSLRSLDLSGVHFDRVSDLANVLSGHARGQRLRSLILCDISLGSDPPPSLGKLSL